MTRFFLDSREIALPLNVSSINQVLKCVEDSHLAPDTVVRQIQIDGLPFVPGVDEQIDLFCNVETRERVEIFTGTVKEIARDSIEEALEYLERVEAAIPSLSTAFQTSPGPDAFGHLRQLYEGLYWLNLLLDKLKTNFHLNFEDVVIRGALAGEHNQKFISILKQLIESQQKKDYFLISDLLEYEICPMVPVWREMLRMLSENVNGAQ